ncbi:MAG TPA: glycogen-binding domain-containing protein [Gemmataceae bacterium]|nr:glycogen-binding domain-containing protein [Gemmataceae bacterium]
MPQASAKALAKKRVTFKLSAPLAQCVLVTGSFCNWQTHSHHLKKDKAGVWKATLSLPAGRYEYRFVVDGEWQNDPLCHERVPNSFGTENCILHVLREQTQEERPRSSKNTSGDAN